MSKVENTRGLNLPGTPRATSACRGMTFTFTLLLLRKRPARTSFASPIILTWVVLCFPYFLQVNEFYGSQKIQLSLSYPAVTDWFLQPRYELNNYLSCSLPSLSGLYRLFARSFKFIICNKQIIRRCGTCEVGRGSLNNPKVDREKMFPLIERTPSTLSKRLSER